MIDPHSALPDGMASQSYNIVTICGRYDPGLSQVNALTSRSVSCELVEIMVFTIKLTPKMTDFEFRFAVERECSELAGQEGCLELLDVRLCKNFRKQFWQRKCVLLQERFFTAIKNWKALQNKTFAFTSDTLVFLSYLQIIFDSDF